MTIERSSSSNLIAENPSISHASSPSLNASKINRVTSASACTENRLQTFNLLKNIQRY